MTEVSLYQIIQEQEFCPLSLKINSGTFHQFIISFIDWLSEQKLKPTLWLKLPCIETEVRQIFNYLSPDNFEQIYLLKNHHKEKYENLDNIPIINLDLEAGNQLKREFFCLAISPHFSGLIIAQKQAEKMEVNCSFEADLIRKFLQQIKQIITINDHTPEQILTETAFLINQESQTNYHLIYHFLLKQVQRQETIIDSSLPSQEAHINLVKLQKILHLKDEFISSLVRELRTPITHMKTALTLLVSKQNYKEERQRYLALLQRECERQNAIVNGLLEVVELNTILDQKTTKSTYLEEVIPTIVSTYQPLAEEKGVQLIYTIPSGLPPVYCSAASLQQIIVNLLNNSLNFTESGGQVSVEAFLKQKYIEIVVSDTGIGILPQDLAKVFNPFYRGRNINNNTNLGAGLGLTLVKQLLENCAGSITIRSKPNQVTIVKVLLSIVEEVN